MGSEPEESVAQTKRIRDEAGRKDLFLVDAYLVLTQAGRRSARSELQTESDSRLPSSPPTAD